jgi:hypothetical protein
VDSDDTRNRLIRLMRGFDMHGYVIYHKVCCRPPTNLRCFHGA